MTLISYRKTQENYEPQVGDECDIFITVHKLILWVKVVEIMDDGRVIVESQNSGLHVIFRDKEELFDAIGNV